MTHYDLEVFLNSVKSNLKKKDRDTLVNSGIDIDKSLEMIESYLLASGSDRNNITDGALKCVVELAYLANRHNLGIEMEEFIDRYLLYYDLKWHKEYKEDPDNLSLDIRKFNTNSSYDIDLRDLQLVVHAKCINRSIDNTVMFTSSYRDNFGHIKLADRSDRHHKFDCLFIDKTGNSIYVDDAYKSACKDWIDYLFYEDYIIGFLPDLARMGDMVLYNLDTSRLNNRDYVRLLKITGRLQLDLKSDLKALKNIEDTEYNFKDILKYLCQIKKFNTNDIIHVANTILNNIESCVRQSDKENMIKNLVNTLAIHSENIILKPSGIDRLFDVKKWDSVKNILNMLSVIEVNDIKRVYANTRMTYDNIEDVMFNIYIPTYDGTIYKRPSSGSMLIYENGTVELLDVNAKDQYKWIRQENNDAYVIILGNELLNEIEDNMNMSLEDLLGYRCK